MMKDHNVFFTSWSKTRFLFSTIQILTPRLKMFRFHSFFIRCFPGCEIRVSGLMCYPSSISLASFGICKQGSQLCPAVAGVLCLSSGMLLEFHTSVICSPCKISQSYLRPALVCKRHFLRSGDRKTGEGLEVMRGSRGPSLWCMSGCRGRS